MVKNVIIENNKLKIENGAFVFTKTSEEFILRSVSQILQIVAGEDKQFLFKGLDLQGVIFNNKLSSSDVYGEIMKNMLQVEGITEVIDINVEEDKEDLVISVQFKYNEQLLEATVNV